MTVIKAGTISVDANSTSVTGSGTNWLLTVSPGDMLKVGQGFEIIESVESNTQLTLVATWSYGAVVDGSYYISQMGVNHDTITTNRLLREYTEKLKSGTLFKPEASGSLAERADYNDEGKGFFYLQADVAPNLVFTKLSDASGDWNAGTVWPAKGDASVVTENGSNGNFDVGGALTQQGQQVWHSGNDGSGSGLDADLLGGLEASTFLKSGILPNASDFNAAVVGGNYRLGAGNMNAPNGCDYGNLFVSRAGSYDTILQICSDYSGKFLYFRNGNPVDVGGTGSWSAWREVWHSGSQLPALYAHFGTIAVNARASFSVSLNIGGLILTNNNETVSAPKTGLYRISWQSLSGGVTAHDHLFLFLNGASVWVGTANASDWASSSGEALLYLNEGDYVELKCTNGGTIWSDGAFNKFNIQFIG